MGIVKANMGWFQLCDLLVPHPGFAQAPIALRSISHKKARACITWETVEPMAPLRYGGTLPPTPIETATGTAPAPPPFPLLIMTWSCLRATTSTTHGSLQTSRSASLALTR